MRYDTMAARLSVAVAGPGVNVKYKRRGMNKMKMMAIILGFAAVAVVIIAASVAPAGAQGGGAPGNVRAVDGGSAGEVTVSWGAVDEADFYRIGWVAFEDIAVVRADGRPWLDAFAFMDVTNYGQTAHTLTGLHPGVEYAFITGSVSSRFGIAQWSEWAYLTLAEAPATSCPTDAGGEPAAPQTPNPTATPTPAATPATTPVPTPTLYPTTTPTPAATPRPTPTGTGARDRDYDTDKDGLIEVSSLAQLAAISADLNGDGVSPAPAYAAAFPDAMPGMGCPDAGCTGYELVANLDFDTNGNGEADPEDAYWNGGEGWDPIGSYDHQFTATFDGAGHTIANLYIKDVDDWRVGLFGVTAISSNIKETGLVSVNVYDFSCYDCGVGALVGDNSGTISNSYSIGSIFGTGHVGGLIGVNRGTIIASNAKGNVSGWHASGEVGGLTGANHGMIYSSYADVSVLGTAQVGGLIGGNYYGGTITASYAKGSVSGSGDDIGGLVGRNVNGAITTSYAVGRISTSDNTFYIGGLVGYGQGGTASASYWDTQTTGQAGSYGGVGKTTAELQAPTTNSGIYADWDASVWDFGNSRQYPALKYGGMDVTAQRP